MLARRVRLPDPDQIGAYRLRDVLELGGAEIADFHLKPPLDLSIGVV